MIAYSVPATWKGEDKMKTSTMRYRFFLGLIGLLLLLGSVSGSVWASGPPIGGQWEAKLSGVLDDEPVKLVGTSSLSLDLQHQTGPVAFDATLKIAGSMGDKDAFEFDMDTACLNYMARDYDIRFGKQRVSWGTAMGLNPTDVINPQDINDPLGDKLPVWALVGQYYLENNVELTGVYLPFFRSAIDAIPTKPQIPVYYPEEDGEWAVKIGALGMAGMDFSLMYFSGYERMPTVRMTARGMEGYYREVDTIGADFATSLGDVGLWLEAAHTTPKEGDAYTNWAIGSDYRLPNGLLVAGQYYHQETGKTQHDYLMFGLEKELAVIHRGKLGAVYDTDSGSFMVNPEVALSLADATELVLGGRYLDRKQGGLGMLPYSDKEIYAQVVTSF
jgi:hypothetical protein